MLPQLKKIIPAHKFEVARDKIAEILLVELKNQMEMGAISVVPDKIWCERTARFDEIDVPAINILLIQATYDNKSARAVDGTYIFAIDVYGSAKSTNEDNGDTLSSVYILRLIGMCRAILENSAYFNLGFNPPFTCTSMVQGFALSDPATDTNNARMGRLSLSFTTTELMELKDPVPIEGMVTGVKLEMTDKGYKYELIP